MTLRQEIPQRRCEKLDQPDQDTWQGSDFFSKDEVGNPRKIEDRKSWAENATFFGRRKSAFLRKW